MRGTRKLQKVGTVLLSVGLAALLVFGFTLAGAFGQGLNAADAAPVLDKTDNNGKDEVKNPNKTGTSAVTGADATGTTQVSTAVTSAEAAGTTQVSTAATSADATGTTQLSAVTTSANATGTTLVPTTFGGNAKVTRFDTATTTITTDGVTVGVFTREQNGQPERVCVQHVVNGQTRVENFMPRNTHAQQINGSDVVVDVIANTPNHTRGNEHQIWQLCAPAAPESPTPTPTNTPTPTPTSTPTSTPPPHTATPTPTPTATPPTPTSTPTPTPTTITPLVPSTPTPTPTTPAAGEEAAPVAGVTVVVVTAALPVVTEAPVGVTATVTEVVAAVTALPRAGGLPTLPSALGGLGLLFSVGGLLLRRYAR